MEQLYIYRSNFQEVLAEQLARVMQRDPLPPLNPEIILVQTKGIERFLSMFLAKRHKVAANINYPFPVSFFYDLTQKIIPELPLGQPLSETQTTWRLVQILQENLQDPELAALRSYLGKNPKQEAIYQLAKRISSLLEEYVVYRPDMVLDWDQGYCEHFSKTRLRADELPPSGYYQDAEKWQARLWELLGLKQYQTHKAALREQLQNRLQEQGEIELPARINLFGISSLAPFYLDLLHTLSQFTRINIFFCAPSEHYYADLGDKRQKSGLLRSGMDPAALESFDQGHPLLASLGKLGKDFLFNLYEMDLPLQEKDFYIPPKRDSLLGKLQNDIFHLREETREYPEEKIPCSDRSIRIHSCHGPMREMQVLQDNILNILDRNPDLNPDDIVVMIPDLDGYIPYIEAIFGNPESRDLKLPYSIADRSSLTSNPVAKLIRTLFELGSSRLSSKEVLSVLEHEIVSRAFGLNSSDMDLIRAWVAKTRITWGKDATDRATLGLPETDAGTWKAGLQRMLLGYAMENPEENLFKDVLPFQGIQEETLNSFLAFLDALFEAVERLNQEHTPWEWFDTMHWILDNFLPDERDSRAWAKELEDAVLEILNESLESECRELLVQPQVYLEFLEQKLGECSVGKGFLAFGITFCSMLPMHSVPFQVVCLAGLNNADFPRQEKKPSFDLMAASPKAGDRSPRLEDRYLFLEALLSARRYLQISYIGRSLTDNSSLPSSVVVSELLDCLENTYGGEQGSLVPSDKISQRRDFSLREQIVLEHPLHPFSREYFQNYSELFTYSKESFQGAKNHFNNTPLHVFASESLPEETPKESEQDIHELSRFLKDPVRYFCQNRLKISLEISEEKIREQEPLEGISGLEDYQVKQTLLHMQQKGYAERGKELLQALNQIPPGSFGEVVYRESTRETNKVREAVKRIQGGEPEFRSKILRLEIQGIQLFGQISTITSRGLLSYRPATLKAKDILGIWTELLFVSCSKSLERFEAFATLVGTDRIFQITPPEDPEFYLRDLLGLLQTGFCTPLQLFPSAAFRYVNELLNKNKDSSQALKAAQKDWKGNQNLPGIREDPYVQLCFGRDLSEIPKNFPELAVQVFEPILKNSTIYSEYPSA